MIELPFETLATARQRAMRSLAPPAKMKLSDWIETHPGVTADPILPGHDGAGQGVTGGQSAVQVQERGTPS